MKERLLVPFIVAGVGSIFIVLLNELVSILSMLIGRSLKFMLIQNGE